MFIVVIKNEQVTLTLKAAEPRALSDSDGHADLADPQRKRRMG